MMQDRQNIVSNIVALRILISYLGEKEQCNWWDTSFLSPTGRQFLAINFPRSAFSAGCNSAAAAAKRLHDLRIGKGGVYHLFRLPAPLEQDLHAELLRLKDESVAAIIRDPDTAMDHLGHYPMAGDFSAEGPVHIGTFTGSLTAADLQRLAGFYLQAFKNNKMCFPYLSQE